VADEVGRDHGVALGESQRHLAPVARGVDHPVDQHHRWPLTGDAVDDLMAVELDLPGPERVVVGDTAQLGHRGETTGGARRSRGHAMFAI
jgi:hypothetical protein